MDKEQLRNLRWGEFVRYHIVPEFPKLRIKKKSTSFLMKVFSWFLFLVSFGQIKRSYYMEKVSTTVGNTIYVPDSWETREDHWNAISVLVHEREHLRQKKKNGLFKHSMAYIFWKFPIGFADYRLEAEIEAEAAQFAYSFLVYDVSPWGLPFESSVKSLGGSLYFWPTFKKTKIEKLLRKKIMEKLIEREYG